jgi:hypothetical protein
MRPSLPYSPSPHPPQRSLLEITGICIRSFERTPCGESQTDACLKHAVTHLEVMGLCSNASFRDWAPCVTVGEHYFLSYVDGDIDSSSGGGGGEHAWASIHSGGDGGGKTFVAELGRLLRGGAEDHDRPHHHHGGGGGGGGGGFAGHCLLVKAHVHGTDDAAALTFACYFCETDDCITLSLIRGVGLPQLVLLHEVVLQTLANNAVVGQRVPASVNDAEVRLTMSLPSASFFWRSYSAVFISSSLRWHFFQFR